MWHTITRLGEAQLLLPAFAATLCWLAAWLRARRSAVVWLAAVGAAALLTTASKVAFIGWGIGYAPWDFTGISGHAMFAAAVLPLLCAAGAGARPRVRLGAIVFGYLLAGLVAWSRVEVHAHSSSECWAGWLLGSLASAAALHVAPPPGRRVPLSLALLLVAGLLTGVAEAPPSRTHDAVTALSLWLSGRVTPYTREMLHQLRAPSSTACQSCGDATAPATSR